MAKKYTSKQFWELYKKLPPVLKDAVSSQETGDRIYEACERYDVLDHLEKVSDCVGQVLIGLLPPDEFQETLEKELSFKKGQAKEITRDLNRFIFYPVKSSLEDIYKIEIAPLAEMKVVPPGRPKTTPSGEDRYREPIG